METIWGTILWQQFGASIDMLEDSLLACPDELWNDRSQQPEFWYLVYHTLFWLDLYSSGSAEGFTPPAPFTLDEIEVEAKGGRYLIIFETDGKRVTTYRVGRPEQVGYVEGCS